MTDTPQDPVEGPTDPQPDPSSVPPNELDGTDDGIDADNDPLDRLRKRVGRADIKPVGSPRSDSRISWNSIVGAQDEPVDPATAAAEPVDPSNFHFDLGGALAKAGDEIPPAPPAAPVDEAPAPPVDTPGTLPRRSTASPAEDQAPPTPSDPLPRRNQPPPIEPATPSSAEILRAAEPAPAADELPRREVPADLAPSSADPVEELPQRTPTSAADPAEADTVGVGRRSVFDDDASNEARLALNRVATDDVASAAELAELASLPTLPTAPAAPPPVASAGATTAKAAPVMTTADVHKFRAAQQREASKNRQGRMFSRVLVVILLIGAAIAGSLVFGRAYLFPNEWSPELIALVDQIEQTGGAEFAEVVPLIVLGPQEYASTVAEGLVANADLTRLPEWRALGIAGGAVDFDNVPASAVAQMPAFYDAVSSRIYRLDDPTVDAAALEAALRTALQTAFAEQAAAAAAVALTDATAVALNSVAPSESTVAPSESTVVATVPTVPVQALPTPASILGTSSPAELVRNIGAIQIPPAVAPGIIEGVPLPIAYDVAAPGTLAGPLAAAGYDLSGRPTTRGADDVIRLLDDALPLAPDTPLGPGETSIIGPVSLGTDDWTLIWSNRMSILTVDRLISDLAADSYRSFDRLGVTCFTANFVMNNEAAATELAAGLQVWVGAGPTNAQADAAAFSSTGVSLTACDPGADAAQSVNGRAVTDVLARQVARATR